MESQMTPEEKVLIRGLVKKYNYDAPTWMLKIILNVAKDYKKLDNSKVIKLACELAEERAENEWIFKADADKQETSIFKYEDGEETSYTDEFQPIFDFWYDYFFNKINDEI